MLKSSLTFILSLSLILTMRSETSSAEVNLLPNLNRQQKESIVICNRELEYCQSDLETIVHPPLFSWKTATISFLAGAVTALLIKNKTIP